MTVLTDIRAPDLHLNRLARSVPYYLDHGCADGRPLDQFPLATKPLIRSNYRAFISRDYAEIAPELARTLASYQGPGSVGFGGHITIEETSGTSGTPLRCPKTMSERLGLGRAMWAQRRTVDALASPQSVWLGERGIRGGPNPWDTALDNLIALYRGIADGRYRWLHGFPALVLEHLEVLDRAGVVLDLPDLRVVECSGTFLRTKDRQHIACRLGVTVVDQYALTETWAVALSCPHGARHVNREAVIVEILDDSDRPVRAGEFGRIVVTSLKERLLPFVRYVTGDTGRLLDQPCPCGTPGGVLDLLEGRAPDFIAGRTPKTLGSRLFGMVAGRAAEASNVHDRLEFLKVVQRDPDRFSVYLNAFEDQPRYRQAFAQAAADLLGLRASIDFIEVSPAQVRAEDGCKPWLFRSLCALVTT